MLQNDVQKPEPRSSPILTWSWAVIVAIMLLGSLLIGTSADIAARPLESHEIFVAQTAREMLASDEWVVPSFNWRPRLVKPPLMYWLVMGLAELSGQASPDVSPLLARLPSAISGMALVALTMWLGVIVYDRRTAVIAGLLAMGTSGFYEYANCARPEMLYAACGGLVTVGLAGAWLSEDGTRRQLQWALLAWIGAGLATLAKGVHLPALMMLGIVVCALCTRGQSWKRLRSVLRPGVGVPVLLAISLPWIIAVVLRRPDAVDVWMDQVFAGPDDDGDRALLKWLTPYYLAMFPALILPWAILLPMGLAVSFQKGRPDLARGRVLFWILVTVIVVMSLQYHRRAYYLLPIVPAAAVLMARGTEDLLVKLLRSPARRSAGWIAGLVSAGAGTLVILLPWLDGPGGIDPFTAWATGAVLVSLAAAAAIHAWRGASSAGALLLTKALAPAVCLALLGGHDELWGERRHQRWAFAEQVAEAVGPGEPVYVYACDGTELVYSLNRPIRELTGPGPPPKTMDAATSTPQRGIYWVVMSEVDWRHTADQWPPHTIADEIDDPIDGDDTRVVLRFAPGES